METGLQKLITSEEDDDEEMGMDVKEEDDGDDEDGEKHVDASQMMAGVDGEMPTISNNNNRLQQHHQFQEQVGTPGGGEARRCRPMEEKDRTKLRERQCRAITARILAGLRRHGNYNLRVRADINDVVAALAREAGWVVLPDGTTFPSKSQGPRLAGVNSAAVTSSSSQIVSPRTPAWLKGVTSGDQSPGVVYRLTISPQVLGPKVHPLLEMEQVKQRVILLLVAPWIMLATNRLLTYP